jgi:hypothetical protein
MTYRAPIAELKFCLEHQCRIRELCQLPYAKCSHDCPLASCGRRSLCSRRERIQFSEKPRLPPPLSRSHA